jgi:hypothetical protein
MKPYVDLAVSHDFILATFQVAQVARVPGLPSQAMFVGVVSYLMTLVNNPLDQMRGSVNPTADDKEYTPCTKFSHQLEDRDGRIGMWTIVKGQQDRIVRSLGKPGDE